MACIFITPKKEIVNLNIFLGFGYKKLKNTFIFLNKIAKKMFIKVGNINNRFIINLNEKFENLEIIYS